EPPAWFRGMPVVCTSGYGPDLRSSLSSGMHGSTPTHQTLGVIDIGSNSGRVLVARVQGAAHLDVLGDAGSPLRLVRDVARDGHLRAETIERTLRILRGFAAVA